MVQFQIEEIKIAKSSWHGNMAAWRACRDTAGSSASEMLATGFVRIPPFHSGLIKLRHFVTSLSLLPAFYSYS